MAGKSRRHQKEHAAGKALQSINTSRSVARTLNVYKVDDKAAPQSLPGEGATYPKRISSHTLSADDHHRGALEIVPPGTGVTVERERADSFMSVDFFVVEGRFALPLIWGHCSCIGVLLVRLLFFFIAASFGAGFLGEALFGGTSCLREAAGFLRLIGRPTEAAAEVDCSFFGLVTLEDGTERGRRGSFGCFAFA